MCSAIKPSGLRASSPRAVDSILSEENAESARTVSALSSLDYLNLLDYEQHYNAAEDAA